MMQQLLLPMSFFVACAVQGGPIEQAITAAMRLSDAPNYGWTATVVDDARSYDLEGKTQKGGYTWVRLPMIKAISLRLGRDADNEIEAVFKGSAPAVLRTENGWKTLGELPRARRDWDAEPVYVSAPAPIVLPAVLPRGAYGRAGLGVADPVDPAAGIPWPAPTRGGDAEHRPFSLAQFAVSHPHDELAVIVSSYVDFQVNGDIASGTLSDVGARLLLVHDGQEEQIEPLCGAGTFSLQIRDGFVVKYHVRLEGIVRVDGKRKILVHQATSTTVKDVGRTLFDVTDEIKRKLGG